MRSQLTLIGKGNPDDCCWQKADNAGLGSNKFSVSKWRLIFEPEITSFSRFLGPHSQIFSHAQAAWPLEHSMHLCYCAELFSRHQNKQPSISERQVKLWNKSMVLSSLGTQPSELSAAPSAKLVSAAEQFCPVSISVSSNFSGNPVVQIIHSTVKNFTSALYIVFFFPFLVQFPKTDVPSARRNLS